ncbi:MAG: hypothetical protein LBI78_03625 [Campylobacteraceae bacterium]|jgi:Spy/CpxP family protein refolding chaperone|nr:hypothetical protein [Campylobacteraceae bacterium]
MKKGLFIIIAASLLTMSSAFARHQMDNLVKHEQSEHAFKIGKKMYKNDFMGGHDGKFLKELDLSLEQKQQIKLLKQEMFLKIGVIFENTSGLKTYFNENSFNKEAFLKDKKEINDTLIDIRADYLDKIYNILTDVQKGRIYEVLDKTTNKWKRKYLR